MGEASPETIRNYIKNQLLCLIAFSPTAKDDWDFSYLVIKWQNGQDFCPDMLYLDSQNA